MLNVHQSILNFFSSFFQIVLGFLHSQMNLKSTKIITESQLKILKYTDRILKGLS